MRLFYSIMIFGVSVQLAAFLIMSFHVDPNINYPVELSNNWLNLGAFDIMFTGGGATAIMLAGILLKQGTYAVYATLIWIVGTLLGPVRNFFIAIPNTIFGVFGPTLNAVNPYTDGTANPLLTVVVYIVTFAAFWFFVELVAQRQIS